MCDACARARARVCVCARACVWTSVAHQLIDRAKVSSMFSSAGGPGLQLRTWSNEAKQVEGKP